MRDELFSDSRELKHGTQNMEHNHRLCPKCTGSMEEHVFVASGFRSLGEGPYVAEQCRADQQVGEAN